MRLSGSQKFLRGFTVCALVTGLALPRDLQAQTHVVTPSELRAAVQGATQSRETNRGKIASFLSTPEATKALGSARIDVNLVKNAVASLSDEELAKLAARADQAQSDFAAGRLSDRDLLWILIGIAALILIIVAVS